MSATDFLLELWFEMRNGAGPEAMARANGAIDMAEAIDGLPVGHGELWRRRIATCPGHDDEAGRDWCAYCGKMPESAEDLP